LKWARRRPTAAALVGVSGAAALGLLVLGVALFVNARQLAAAAGEREAAERDRANESAEREKAERERGNLLDAQIAIARSHVYTSEIALANQTYERNDSVS